MTTYKGAESQKSITHEDVIAFLKTIGIDTIKDKIPLITKPQDNTRTKLERLEIGVNLTSTQKTAIATKYPELTEQ